MNHSEKELAILEKIHNSRDPVKQRDLAKIAGLSLGMTNAILKRLIDKGLVTARKINSRNILYAVSPAGIEEISRRSYRYFKRTIKNVAVYKEAIDDVVKEAKDMGYKTICLFGKSDIDFIIEHCCSKNRMIFKAAAENHVPEKDEFVIISETGDSRAPAAGPGRAEKSGARYIRDIIT